jgi:ribosomal protein S18 acetylase RimI-like enzyme
MKAVAFEMRRLLAADAEIYRDLRLTALRDSPDAFSSTYEAEKDRPLDAFASRLHESHVVGAFAGPRLVGMAGFYIQPGPKHAHKGMLWGMYVRPRYRGAGLGRRLVDAIIEHARERVELLQLFVVSDNLAARRLYQSLGFVEYGIERHATKYRGEYHDDVLMALPLMVDSAAAASPAPTEDVPA